MSVIHTPGKPKLDVRQLTFPIAMLALLVVLFFRLWYFQVVKAPELLDRADATRKDKFSRAAPRGLIFDRNGVLLAGLKPDVVVSIVYSIVSKNPGELETLASKLNISPKVLRAKLADAKHSPALPCPLAAGVSPQVGTEIAESSAEFPGVEVDLEPTRYYPNRVDYSHILGSVRKPDRNDLSRIKSKGLVPAQYVGKSGIERAYEKDLMGVPGDEVMEIDAKRRPLRIVQRDNPSAGKTLVLGLDSRLQHTAAQLMSDNHYVGAAVAIVPSTGEILCMVSSPTYDEAIYQDKDALKKVEEDPDKPLFCRALTSRESPGSTFKIITSLAAYETGKFDPNRPVDCEGGFQLGNARFTCLGHHGSITYQTALEKSCNTYFYDLGHRVGQKALTKAAEEAGLGQPTDIDIGGERKGVNPSPEWVEKHFKSRHWFGGDTLNFSIGQGYVSATPLQMCDVAAMVANNGTIYKPHLVKGIKDSPDDSQFTSVKPEVLHHVEASPYFWSTLKKALVGVIDRGTAQRAKIPGVEWGGKTGSTEHGHKLLANGKEPKTHAWFIGFAPAENPKIAVCVLVENAGHGGDVSAPIAREIVAQYLKRQAAKSVAKVTRSASITAASLPSPKAR